MFARFAKGNKIPTHNHVQQNNCRFAACFFSVPKLHKRKWNCNQHIFPTASNGARPASSYARFSGPDYSQSISVDTANSLINSYLTSVNYPTVDTALRALSFDADTLRAYLQNSNIVTLKFMIAHTPSYKAEHAGVYAGMNPNAFTVIIVGQDENDHYVFNNRNQVYEHFQPCPYHCDGASGASIY